MDSTQCGWTKGLFRNSNWKTRKSNERKERKLLPGDALLIGSTWLAVCVPGWCLVTWNFVTVACSELQEKVLWMKESAHNRPFSVNEIQCSFLKLCCLVCKCVCVCVCMCVYTCVNDTVVCFPSSSFVIKVSAIRDIMMSACQFSQDTIRDRNYSAGGVVNEV